MKLSDLAKATAAIAPNHSILVYGPPKAGKSRLVATAAKLPEIKNIYWFDFENGAETLLHMGFTPEEMDKITIFKIPNTRDNPVAIETMLKLWSAKAPVLVCDEHGIVSCVQCKGKSNTLFSLGTCTHSDLVVLDSGSELGDSALSATLKGKDNMYKPGWDEYGLQGKWLGDILSVIQQAKHTNFVVITHEIALEDDQGKDKIFPLMGSKAFCLKVAKYFGTVAYVHMKLNKHVAGSASTYRSDVLTGSRVNAQLEMAKEPDMRQILVEGGILKPPTIAVADVVTVAPPEVAVEVPDAKPLSGLAAALAAKRAAKP